MKGGQEVGGRQQEGAAAGRDAQDAQQVEQSVSTAAADMPANREQISSEIQNTDGLLRETICRVFTLVHKISRFKPD